MEHGVQFNDKRSPPALSPGQRNDLFHVQITDFRVLGIRGTFPCRKTAQLKILWKIYTWFLKHFRKTKLQQNPEWPKRDISPFVIISRMAICRERVTYLPRNLQEPVSPWKHAPKITVRTCSSGHDTLSGENRAQPAAVAAWVSPSFGTPPSTCIRPFPPTSVMSSPPWKARGASRLGHLGAGRVTLRMLRETLQVNVLNELTCPSTG